MTQVSTEWEMKVLVTQLCPTLCDPMNCSPPGSSVHGILQARILEWVAISFTRGSSWPKDWTQVFCIVGRFFIIWPIREAHHLSLIPIFLENYGTREDQFWFSDTPPPKKKKLKNLNCSSEIKLLPYSFIPHSCLTTFSQLASQQD